MRNKNLKRYGFGYYLLYLLKRKRDAVMGQPVHHRDFSKEIRYTATRSSGAGGQNVNKVSTRIELRFSVVNSLILSDEEKALLLKKLTSRINADGELVLSAQTERSQHRNKQQVLERFIRLLADALKEEKPRIPTKPTKTSRIRRMTHKLRHSQKKQLRRFDNID